MSHVPFTADTPWPPALALHVERTCRAFEAAWQGDARPRLEAFLAETPEPEQPVLLRELLLLDLEYRRKAGDDPTPEEYQRHFPAHAELIEALFRQTAPPADTPDASAGRRRTVSAKPPPVLGEYELLERLGAGGMGEVYRARHQRLDKVVALKLLPGRTQDSKQCVARFRREMKALGRLDHPNVVEALDAGEQAGIVYLVMKLIDGTDLARLVRERGPLPVAEACDLARQTALGLHYLHQRGLIHRDLKPSNLMRTPDGTVKILDLGLARWQPEITAGDNLTASGVVLGTPDYLAPEQVRGAAVDIRTDLYGLGGTLFFLLTGRAPFAHQQGLGEKLNAHRDEAPPDVCEFRREVPAALADLVRRLLAKEARDRPQTPAEVAAALAVFAGGSTPAPARTRRRWPWLAAAGAVLILVLGVVLSWPGRNPPESPAPAPVRPPDAVAAHKLEVMSLNVKHFASIAVRFDQPRGVLGKDSFVTRHHDGVTLEARLSQPAHAFLIAFRPDGTEELCFPEHEDEPPPLTDRPRYPSVARDAVYSLDEGAGLQVFAVVASRRPLPAYKVWRPQCPASPWKKAATPPGVVWWDNGDEVLALTTTDPNGNRKKGERVPGKTPVAELTDWLRRGAEVDAAAVVGFGVLPKKGP